MLELRKMTDEDRLFVLDNPFEDQLKGWPDSPPERYDWTCVFDGEIVAVGGLIKFYDGVGEVWIMLTEHARKRGVFGVIARQAIEKKMTELIEQADLWRVQARVCKDFLVAVEFMKWLGFEYESTMTEAGRDRKDLLMFRKLIK